MSSFVILILCAACSSLCVYLLVQDTRIEKLVAHIKRLEKK